MSGTSQTYQPEVAASRLPAGGDALVGRANELATVVKLVKSASHRLITICGPGGVGKTSLALAAAKELDTSYGGRVWWAPLDVLREPGLLLEAIGQITGAIDRADGDQVTAVLASIGPEPALLALDNLEHLLDGVTSLSNLMESAPNLTILATSREPLRLRSEQEFPLQPLAVQGAEGVAGPAVTLFCERAASVAAIKHDDPLVHRICERVNGLPLAIELAATWARVLTPARIVEMLEQDLDALESAPRNFPERHQTMRAAIGWSYKLLSHEEQVFFRRLSVFNGSFDLEAALAIVTDTDSPPSPIVALSLLNALVSKSLIQPVPIAGDDGKRFQLLETIRSFGREQLIANAEDEIARDRALIHFKQACEQLITLFASASRASALRALDLEYPNLRAALAWAIESADKERGCSIVGALGRYWEARGLMHEGMSWTERALAMPGEVSAPAMKSARYSLAIAQFRTGQYDAAAANAQLMKQDCERANDEHGVAASLNTLAIIAFDRGNFAESAELSEQALAIRRRLGEQRGIDMSLNNLAIARYQQGEYEAADEHWNESLQDAQLRDDQVDAAWALNGLGLVALRTGELDDAQRYIEQAVEIRREDDSGSYAASLVNLAMVLREQGHWSAAMEVLREAIPLRSARGEHPGVADALATAAIIAVEQGFYAEAITIIAAVEQVRAELGVSREALEGRRLELAAERARIELGEREAEQWSTAGKRLPMEEVIALALAIEIPVAQPEVVPRPDGLHVTKREWEILALLGEGKSDQEIADHLFISRPTASKHLANIYRKIRASNRAAAVTWAANQGQRPPT